MTIVIPLRIMTAFAGLIVGYYVGYFIEDKRRAEQHFSQFYRNLTAIYSTATMVNDILSDLDDDCGELIFDEMYTDTSDEDTEYSSENETRDGCMETTASGSLSNSLS